MPSPTHDAQPSAALGPGIRHAILWPAAYFLLAVAPLVVVLLGDPSPRGFWGDSSAGLGFVALSMLGLQFLLTARFRRLPVPYGLDILLHYHRQVGIIAFGLILIHPLIFFGLDPDYLGLLDVRALPREAGLLWGTVAALTVIVLGTLWRRRLRIPYDWWRLTHGLLAAYVVLASLDHVLSVNNHVDASWQRLLWTAASLTAVGLLGYSRVVKPLAIWRKPYEVVATTSECERVWTLALEPRGHAGMHFRAGQFAWLTLGNSPFSLEQHPFSFASSASAPERIAFTIKALGDYTSKTGDVEIGTRAFLEGPYGAFTLSSAATSVVFIAGGVGVTPVISILRTLRDDADKRPLTLVYASKERAGVLFQEELDSLREVLDLRIVHVLERAPAAWTGPSGFVTESLLREQLPPDQPGAQYFICGPEPLMNVVNHYLIAVGVPVRRRREERFNIA